MTARVVVGLLAVIGALPADLYFLDEPSTVSLRHGEFLVAARLQSGGGVMARAGVGLFNRLTLGLSYGVDGLLGRDTIRLPPVRAVGFQARLLGLDEGQWNPSIMVGFESQGYDGYSIQEQRFVTLPVGGYVLLGKTFWGPSLEVALGVSYLPPIAPSSAAGFDGHLALREFYFADWEFIAEYVLALNDQPSLPYRGLLNLAIARHFGESVALKFGLRDILGRHQDNARNRILDISFQQHF